MKKNELVTLSIGLWSLSLLFIPNIHTHNLHHLSMPLFFTDVKDLSLEDEAFFFPFITVSLLLFTGDTIP